LKMVSLEWRSLMVTEECSKVLKVGQGGDLTMTAESRRSKAVPPPTNFRMIGRSSTKVTDGEEARRSSIAKFRMGSRRSNPGFSESKDIDVAGISVRI